MFRICNILDLLDLDPLLYLQVWILHFPFLLKKVELIIGRPLAKTYVGNEVTFLTFFAIFLGSGCVEQGPAQPHSRLHHPQPPRLLGAPLVPQVVHVAPPPVTLPTTPLPQATAGGRIIQLPTQPFPQVPHPRFVLVILSWGANIRYVSLPAEINAVLGFHKNMLNLSK